MTTGPASGVRMTGVGMVTITMASASTGELTYD